MDSALQIAEASTPADHPYGAHSPFPFTLAFQPIVDVRSATIFAYEALVRGLQNETAASILSQVTRHNRYAFDQSCRVHAIQLATRLGLQHTGAMLSVNFLPGAVCESLSCIQTTLQVAHECNFPIDKLLFEITEDERINDRINLNQLLGDYRHHGLQIALDDFGAGYAGLGLLAEFSADVIKIDMGLIRDIEKRPVAYAIVKSIADLCNRFGMRVIAEGIETIAEFRAVRSCGIYLMQGYLFARPAFEALPQIIMPGAMERMPLLAETPLRLPYPSQNWIHVHTPHVPTNSSGTP